MRNFASMFLEYHIQEIDDNNYSSLIHNLYQEAVAYTDVTSVFKTLRDAGIDILNYIDFIPSDYATMDSDITRISLPKHITHIGDSAFRDCRNLSCVDLSNVKVVGTSAFADCDNLTVVKFPKTLEHIAGWAFAGSGVQSFIYPLRTRDWNTNVTVGEDWAEGCSATQVTCADGYVII